MGILRFLQNSPFCEERVLPCYLCNCIKKTFKIIEQSNCLIRVLHYLLPLISALKLTHLIITLLSEDRSCSLSKIFIRQYIAVFSLWGSLDGALLRALTSHQFWLAQFLPLCMFLSCSKGFSPVFLPSQKLTSSIFYLISIWSGQRILSKCYEQCKNFCQFSAVYLIRVPFQSLDSGTFSCQNICNSVTLQL